MISEEYTTGKLYKSKREFILWDRSIRVLPEDVFFLLDYKELEYSIEIQLLLQDGTIGKALFSRHFFNQISVTRAEE